MTAFLAIAVVPYGAPVHRSFGAATVQLQIADLDVGVLYLFADLVARRLRRS